MILSDISDYMTRARQFALLTREDEVSLCEQITAGREAEKKLKVLPGDKNLLRVAAEGQRARDTFLNANLRLVVSIAGGYKWSSLGMQDLIQEGNLGLMRAVEKFDASRGFRFSTYASWWVRQALHRASQNSDMIRLPVYRVDIRNRVRKNDGLAGTYLSDEAVAGKTGMTIKEVAAARQLPQVVASLDEPIGEEDGTSLLIDTLRDDDTEDAESAAILEDTGSKIGELFDGLSERTRLIFEMRYGESCASLQEISNVTGLTRERVRQILLVEGRSLRKRATEMGLSPTG